MAFSKDAFCLERCSYGRGGNLCQCNAFHFAGKRADIADPEDRELSEGPTEDEWKAKMPSPETFEEYASKESTAGHDILKLSKNAKNIQKIFAKIFPQRLV